MDAFVRKPLKRVPINKLKRQTAVSLSNEEKRVLDIIKRFKLYIDKDSFKAHRIEPTTIGSLRQKGVVSVMMNPTMNKRYLVWEASPAQYEKFWKSHTRKRLKKAAKTRHKNIVKRDKRMYKEFLKTTSFDEEMKQEMRMARKIARRQLRRKKRR